MLQNKLLIFSILFYLAFNLESFCLTQPTFSYVDISKSKIIKTNIYSYQIEIFNNPIEFLQQNIKNQQNQNKGELFLKGNFSRIRLINNALKKQYIYQSNLLIISLPGHHIYSKNKSAAVQIQLIHSLSSSSYQPQQSYHTLIMSQLFLVTKFQSKIQTKLSSQINQKLKNKDILQMNKMMKIIQNTPVLMYKGTQQMYPCKKSDILVMVRKEFVLISQQDMEMLQKTMRKSSAKSQFLQKDKQNDRRIFLQKQLYEVNEISSRQLGEEF